MSNASAIFVGADLHAFPSLWLTDGTSPGTVELASFQIPLRPPTDLTALGNKVLFAEGSSETNLWVTDGTSTGTSELNVISIYGQPLETPSDLTVFGNKVLFSGFGGDGANLWVTDGTVAGTSELIVSGSYTGVLTTGALAPADLTVFGTKVLFAGSGPESALAGNLWITDGTAAGTSEIATTGGYGINAINPQDITTIGNKALFSGIDLSPGPMGRRGLWVTDGTAAGTSQLAVAGASPLAGLGPSDLVALGNKAFFLGAAGLFVSDGTSAGTSELLGPPTNPLDLMAFGTKVIFDANDANGVRRVWVTNGTSAGTSELNVPGLNIIPLAADFTVFQNKVLFAGEGPAGFDLWSTDGTVAGTTRLTTSGGVDPRDLTVVGNEVLFTGPGPGGAVSGLWVTDGTSGGTSQLTVAGSLSVGVKPTQITAFNPLCFHHGTRIATSSGETPVQDLRAGDPVLTAGGAAVPVRWIGERRIDLTRHPEPDAASPIRILRGAFAPDVPRRDLLVSPDHAMLLDGLLISARLLVNGATILRETGLPAVHYFHVELEAHGILIAEGAASESYLDTGNRGLFDNAGVPLVLHPDFLSRDGQAIRERDSCAPFATDAARVRPVWDRLAVRAGALGHAVPVIETTSEPELRVMVEGRAIRPVSARGDEYVFALPRGCDQLRLLSRAAAPSDTAPWSDDRRRLGVMVRRIVLETAGEFRVIVPDHPSLADGWWGAEGDEAGPWRWTNGDAALPLPAMTGPALLRVACRAGAYPIAVSAGSRERRAA